MNLPSFIWLWKLAAWSMGLSIASYFALMLSGWWIFDQRQKHQPLSKWLYFLHLGMGLLLTLLVLLLLGIGIVGTLGHFGSLGHSWHLLAGLFVVSLVFLAVWSAVQITLMQIWARVLHVGTSFVLLIGFVWVSLTGWDVVQKYLP